MRSWLNSYSERANIEAELASLREEATRTEWKKLQGQVAELTSESSTDDVSKSGKAKTKPKDLGELLPIDIYITNPCGVQDFPLVSCPDYFAILTHDTRRLISPNS